MEQATALLRGGDVVALPTETVYGLAADASKPDAVQKIFAIKGRPATNPLIVHVASLEMARSCASEWPSIAEKLAAAFWPGPLTLVLPKSPIMPNIVTAGGRTVGVRWPSHEVIQAVIRRCHFPLAAPSANRSGAVSPTTAEHVQRSLGDQIPLIVDGGPAEHGIESTVLDVSVSPPQLLRPGVIHIESLAAVVGLVRGPGLESSGPVRSPGMMLKHYAPKARVLLWRPEESLATLLARTKASPERACVLARTRLTLEGMSGQVSAMPKTPDLFGRALYAELHRCDLTDAELIIIEAVPDTVEWQAVADRLRRAAA
ncbi:MAG: L-threonylcarbamoyladenylate synthase [Verrucomicrobiota bacterium]